MKLKCLCEVWVGIRSGGVLRQEGCGKSFRGRALGTTSAGMGEAGWQAVAALLLLLLLSLISFPLALLLTVTPSANNHRACRMPEMLYQATYKSDIPTLVITLL